MTSNRDSEEIRKLANDVALVSFPMRALGIDFRRNVTLLRLRDDRLVIHSTAPFRERDLAVIRSFGKPSWLVDATLMHDTFAKAARAVLPDLAYLTPAGFTEKTGIPTELLSTPPAEWTGEIDVLGIDGVRTNEHALFHRSSRTLLVADLFFSFPAETRGWSRFFARHIMRLPQMFGMSVFFRRLMIRDKQAFARSMSRLLEWNFERVVVAHWAPVERDAKRAVEQALRDGGFLPG